MRRRTIVGGHGVKGRDYQWMSSLRYELPGRRFKGTAFTAFQRFCGGTLISINPIAVMTAAHCLDSFQGVAGGIQDFAGDDIDFFIDFGRTLGPHLGNPPGSGFKIGEATFSDTDKDWVSIKVSHCGQVYIHPDWTGNAVEGNDIAVIVVRDPSEIAKLKHYPDKSIASIPRDMRLHEKCCDDNEQLTAIGYGLDDDLKDPTNTLEKITIEYHPAKECGTMLTNYYGKAMANPAGTNDIVCASGATQSHKEVDTCQGDSVCTFTTLYITNQSINYLLLFSGRTAVQDEG